MKNARFYYSLPLVKATVVMVEDSSFDTDNILGYYSKTRQALPRITICSVLDKETNTLSFGVALCSVKDRFVKEIGRELSYKRAIENPILTLPVTKENVSMVRMQACEELEAKIWKMNPKHF